ncbi:MAG: tRNA dihydrouridine synthase [Candidatus Methylacidiphilales bacterium]
MRHLQHHFPAGRPVLILAPMQDVTDLPFWELAHAYGGPDIYFTEYFRVHPNSVPDRKILQCLRRHPTGKPAIAQMIGQSIPDLVRTAQRLQQEQIIALDLNVGCPAPIVCRKSAGGGLLRHLDHLDAILGALRRAVDIPLTVKTRIGFNDPEELDGILDVILSHDVDMLTLHGRTVKEMYRAHVHYDRIRHAVERVGGRFPVIANGNVLNASGARDILRQTGAAGLMIGRGCIRNPWIWNQIRETFTNAIMETRPTLRDLRVYVEQLYQHTRPAGLPEKLHIAKMKKYMNFVAQGIGEDDGFVQGIRRAQSEAEFFALCDLYLDRDGDFDGEPLAGALVNAGNPRTECHRRTPRFTSPLTVT